MIRFQIAALLCVLLLYSSCQTGSSDSANGDQTASTTEPAETNQSNTGVFHINHASAEDLATIPGFSTELANKLIGQRPFLTIDELTTSLGQQFSSDELEVVFQQVFLPLNLNTTPESVFKLIPGVGDKMAHEFDEYRPYTSIEQFRREIGKYVDETEVARYEQYVFVPIDLNTATDDDILAIPGVGNKMLHEFKEYRPYTSIEQFRREIGKYVDEKELARLERHVEIR